nr:MAG TPA: hypothetical protein [Caudoviricetes sp.]
MNVIATGKTVCTLFMLVWLQDVQIQNIVVIKTMVVVVFQFAIDGLIIIQHLKIGLILQDMMKQPHEGNALLIA